MTFTRRTMLAAAAATLAPAVLRPVSAQAASPNGAPTGAPTGASPNGVPTGASTSAAYETPRFIGPADAKVSCIEFYSMTCPHCARFATEVFPQVKSQLIDTGKLKYVFGDFPLDRLALTAAMVARALPPERYEPFVLSLLASQSQWAYGDVNHTEELFKRAAIAGMSRETFDATVKNTALQNWILQEQKTAQEKYQVDSTPTFIVGPKKAAGEISFDAFNQMVQSASS